MKKYYDNIIKRVLRLNFQCVEGSFLTQHEVILQIPGGCPTIQLQFRYYLPRDSMRFHRLRVQPYKTPPFPTSAATHKPRLLPVLGTNWLQIEVPKTPSSGSTNCESSSQNSRETFYLLDHWFIIKGYNSGMTRWKRYIG